MTILRMKGVRVTSLEEFRKNFDFTNAKDYLREGRLSRWVRELGETELADALAKLNVADCGDEALLKKFVGIFGLKKTAVRLPETAAPASVPEEPATAEIAPSPETLRRLADIRKKLEDPDFSGKIATPRDPVLIKELPELVREYFEKWSAALRKAPGRAVSGNKWELHLPDLAEYPPFIRCAELLNRLTSKGKTGKTVQALFDLPLTMAWTTVSRPEQLEKSRVIAAYSVCSVEFEYRIEHAKAAKPVRKRTQIAKKAAKPARKR